MSGSIAIGQINDQLTGILKKFRCQKTPVTSALVLQINVDTQQVELEELLEDCSIADLQASLPEGQPRFALLAYKLEHEDGRVSFPLCLIHSSPPGCSPNLQMLYAGSKNNLVLASGAGKIFEVRDLEDLTEEFIEEKLFG